MGDHGKTKGHISPVFSVHCGRCPGHATFMWPEQATRNGTAEAARSAGWKKTKAHGWVCPGCLREPA